MCSPGVRHPFTLPSHTLPAQRTPGFQNGGLSTDARAALSLTPSPPTQTPRQPLGLLLFLAVAGVGLPAFTLGFELVTRATASDLFDPLPTPLHVLLVALVPLANDWLLWAISRQRLREHPVLARLHGLVMGLSLLYALLFLSITPLAVITIAFMGLGLLLALLVLVAADLPSTVTRLGLQAATREVPSERAAACGGCARSATRTCCCACATPARASRPIWWAVC